MIIRIDGLELRQILTITKKDAKGDSRYHLYAGEDIIKDILPVVDNFERALDSMKDKDDPFYKGIELIYQQLKSVLENTK